MVLILQQALVWGEHANCMVPDVIGTHHRVFLMLQETPTPAEIAAVCCSGLVEVLVTLLYDQLEVIWKAHNAVACAMGRLLHAAAGDSCVMLQ